MDDLARERFRRDARRLPLSTSIDDTPALLVQVFQQTTIPTTAGVFYACHPASVFGAEVEGQPGTLTVDTSQTVYVLVVGKPAALGDYLIAKFASNRWVAEGAKPAAGTACIQVKTCSGGTLGAGLSIVASQAGTTIASGTTGSTGTWCPTVATLPSGTYDFTVSGTGIFTRTLTGQVWANSGTGVRLILIVQPTTITAQGSVVFTANPPCNNALVVETCVVTGPAGFSATFTMNSTGNISTGGVHTLNLGEPGTYNWSMSCASPRWQPQSGTFTNPSCASTQNITVILIPALGYVAIGSCGTPVSTTLHVSDTLFGYSGVCINGRNSLSINGCLPTWTDHSASLTIPACGSCPGGTITGIVEYNPGGVSIKYPTDSVTGCPGGNGLGPQGSYMTTTSANNTQTCPPGFTRSDTYTTGTAGSLDCGAGDTWTASE